MRALSLKIPYSDKEIRAAIDTLTEKNRIEEASIRIILTGGNTLHGIEFEHNHPTFYMLMEKATRLPEEKYDKGGTLVTFEHQRAMAEFKTINYITGVLVQPLRKEKNAIEVLYTHLGKALEAATSNFFIVRDNVLITPKENVLPGITRQVVIDLARPHFRVEERDVLLSELEEASEAFITASYKEVAPVVKIDEQTIGTGEVGPVTKRIMDLFAAETRAYKG